MTSTSLTTSLGTSSTAPVPTGSTEPGETGTTGSSATDTVGSTTAGDCPDDWWDCAWTVRQSITLQGMPLGAAVTALPFPARLDPALFQDESLVIVDESGDPVVWERDETLVWLRTDVEPDVQRRLWAYGGNPRGAPPGFVQSVWDDSFVAVWHLSDGEDASAWNNDATPNGVVPEDGRFDSATRFDGVDDQLDVPATDSLADLRATGLTAELWFRPEFATADTYKRIFDKSDATVSTLGWSILLIRSLPTAQLQVDLGYPLGEGRAQSGTFDASEWVHLVVTIDTDDTIGFWVNAQPLESTPTPIRDVIVSDADQPGSIGSLPGEAPSVRFYDGLMDEFRISRGVRSAAWILGTYTSGLPEAVAVEPLEDLQRE